MRQVLALATVLIALAAPAASQAADHVEIGAGGSPAVAVDDAGTAYIAWIGPEPQTNSLQFCKLPRNAMACSESGALKTTGNSLTRPFVALREGLVLVVQYRYQEKKDDQQGVYVWTSSDGGATFGDGRRIGSIPFHDAVVGPGDDTLSLVTDAVTEGELFQNVPLGTQAADDRFATLSGGGDRPYRGAVGMIDENTPLVISTDAVDEAAFRRYRGPQDLEDAEGWTGPDVIGTFGYPHLAGGSAGLFAIGGTEDRMIAARKYGPAGFSAPVNIDQGDAPNSHLFQDEGARLHAVFNQFAADGLHLVHAVSDDGTAWRVGTVLVQDIATDGAITGPRIATAEDHRGVIVWGAGTPDKDVRVMAVGPDAPKPIVQVAGSASSQGGGVVISLSGTLTPPGELTKAQACADKGTVRIRVKRGKKTIATRSAAVRANCAYKLKTKVPRSRVKGARKLRVQARFGGNDALASAARTKTIKVRRG